MLLAITVLSVVSALLFSQSKQGDEHIVFARIEYDRETSRKMPNGTGDLTTLICNPLLFIDISGKRFCNEEEIFNHKIPVHSNSDVFCSSMIIIIDSGLIRRIAVEGLNSVFDCIDHISDKSTLSPCMVHALQEPRDFTSALEDAVNAGLAKKADSIEALSKELFMDNLVSEIDSYNELCLKKKDFQFNKSTQYLNSIKDGPFYAVCVNLMID